MKHIVRVGLEMHIDRAPTLTRDLWPCYCVFAEHCPDRAKDMWALKLAVEPTSDPDDLLASVGSLGRWVRGEEAGIRPARSYPLRSTSTFLVWVYPLRASAPPSLPQPDPFMPPKGALWGRSP